MELKSGMLLLIVWANLVCTTASGQGQTEDTKNTDLSLGDSMAKYLPKFRQRRDATTAPPATTAAPPAPHTFGLIVIVTKDLIENDSVLNNSTRRLRKIRINPENSTTRYKDGKTCDLGQDPWTVEEVDRILELVNNLSIVQRNGNGAMAGRLNLSNGQQATLNDGATLKYGNNCRSEKCYYDQLRNSYICSSHMNKPVSFLVALLFFFQFLPTISMLNRLIYEFWNL